MSQPEYGGSIPDETGEIEKYRSVDVMSILTLVAAIFSFVALFKTTFWILPLVTVVLGVISLRSLARRPERIGRKVAVLGLAIAVFFGTWAPARYFSRQYWLTRHAKTYADAWVALLQAQQLPEVHQLHLPPIQRAKTGISLEEHYAKAAFAQGEFDSFFAQEPLKTIVALKGDFQIHYVQRDGFVESLHSDSVTLRYLVTFTSKGHQEELPIRLVLERDADRNGEDYAWYVNEVKLVHPEALAATL